MSFFETVEVLQPLPRSMSLPLKVMMPATPLADMPKSNAPAAQARRIQLKCLIQVDTVIMLVVSKPLS